MLLRLKLCVNSLNVAGGGWGGVCSASASDAWSLSSVSAPSSDAAACRWFALCWTELLRDAVFTAPTLSPAPPCGPKLSSNFRICCNESLCRTILSNNWHFFPSSCMRVSLSCSFLWMFWFCRLHTAMVRLRSAISESFCWLMSVTAVWNSRSFCTSSSAWLWT